ncbi:MRN complex-interacting protein isoform X2 [Neopelma chrysocephalum]|uniref:MRN complex-interacting protein isoform X2 n=1 Tax=Neopelma chrysocephalum TaxID=114329 RepID=UPI000FCD2096|nr:MRN complex-interacting protein isoform X2 [Neopelma chrysocephalum]
MAQQFRVLRCCRCRRFQVHPVKRGGKWSCSVCGQRQAVQKVYGQGSGPDCRHHVQKLNLLQGEAEEALGWTSWCIEDSVNDSKTRAAQREDSLVQQEGSQTLEGSRWSKYLDQESEDQEDGEEEAALARQQFCSQKKNAVGEQRKHRKSFLSSDVLEHAEENGVFQSVYQAKKRKKCFAAVPDGDDRDAVSGGRVVPAVCEAAVPEDNTQPPTTCARPSKWGKFLSSSDNSSENTAGVTSSLWGGSGGLGLDSTTAAGAGGGRRCSEQAGGPLPQGTGFKFKKCVASTEGLAMKLPSTRCSTEDVSKEPQSQTETTAGSCCLVNTRRANTLVNSNPGPKLSNISCEKLFCTGEEFDDDL